MADGEYAAKEGARRKKDRRMDVPSMCVKRAQRQMEPREGSTPVVKHCAEQAPCPFKLGNRLPHPADGATILKVLRDWRL
eukprot:3668215-Pyramimonas_sp.AAC.1